MRASIWAAALLLGAAACGDAATSPAVDGETGTGLPVGRGQSGGASTINPSVALANSTVRDCPRRCAFPISVRAGEPTATDASSLTEDAGMLFGYLKPTRWSLSGGGTTLAAPAGYGPIYAVQQNGWGQVAGYVNGGNGYIATVWEPDGTPIVLSDRPYGPPLPGKARAINDNSVIVGESGGRAFRTHYKDGFRWLSGPGSAAYDINYQGEIVGYSTIDGAMHATVWAPDGTATDLGIAPGAFNYSLAVSISETGIVVGYSAPTRNNFGRFAGFIWSRAEGTTALPADFVPADVNHWGEVAGQSSQTLQCAVYYKGYGMLDLPRTTNSKVGCQALSINSWGDVVGFETVEVPGQENSYKPLVWTWGGNEGRYGF